MTERLNRFFSGMHFRFLMLVIGLAVAMLMAQFATDTAAEWRRIKAQRVADALNITEVVARTLEKRFEQINLGDVEAMLAVIANRTDVSRLTITDRELAFLLDGDPSTPPVPASGLTDIQLRSMKTGTTEYEVHGDTIEVSEPLVASDGAIGSVMVSFDMPGLSQTMLDIIYGKLITMVPILLTGLLFAIGLVSQVTAPMRQLGDAARSFSEGNAKTSFRIGGAREIRQLGEAFELMAGKLRSSIDQISQIAYVDRTTQLPNREYFHEELERALKCAKRQRTAGAVLFVDLDGFKRVNDSLGHEAGDSLLSAFSNRISDIIRSGDTIARVSGAAGSGDEAGPDDQTFARLGGDEFTVILSEIREETDAGLVAQRIIDATAEPFEIDGVPVRIGVSIGIATFPRDGADARSILRSADMAMYEAKAAGKNTYRFYSAELDRQVARRQEMEAALKSAIEREQLELHYQPRIECCTGEAATVEALLRWHHPERGTVNPGEFIAIAEKAGLMLPLGTWVLGEACQQAQRFEQEGLDLAVSVNVSMQQFERADFALEVLKQVREAGIDARRLQLEISEKMATMDPQRSLDHIRRLKRAGVRFAIEDFGAGYSNLSQLSRLPLDFFEIDVSFLDALSDEIHDQGRLISRSVLTLAKSLRCSAIAKGVENEDQYQFLVDCGCDYAQGYLFARPMPASELNGWLAGRDPSQWARSPSVDARSQKAVA